MSTRAQPRRALHVTLVALSIAFGFWLLAWTSIASLLALDARDRVSQWQTSHQTPWRWSFARPDAVVWPGSHGFERDPDSPVSLTGVIADGIADLSLALRGERIDPALVSHAQVRLLHLKHDVRIVLLGETDRETIELGAITAKAADGILTLPLRSPSPDSLRALRLRLETAAGARVTLLMLALSSPGDVNPVGCEESEDIGAMMAACTTRVPLLDAPTIVRPEAMLTWRDQVRVERPAAIVRADESIPTATRMIDALRQRPGGWPFWTLATLPLLAALISRALPRPGPGRALLELALVCGPWALLLWGGWPADDPVPGPSWTFLACVLGALGLRDPTPDWHFVGSKPAWSAATKLFLPALALVILAAVANARDHDGFALRALGREEYWRYPLWALLQQGILIRMIAPRMRIVFGSDSSAAVAAGALFGLLHLPNFSLMLLTFGAGSAWAWLGYRWRSLLPLALSHALLGLAMFSLAPPWLLRSAEIGGRYLMAP